MRSSMKNLLVMFLLLASCNVYTSEGGEDEFSLSTVESSDHAYESSSIVPSGSDDNRERREWDRGFSNAGFKLMLCVFPCWSALQTGLCYADVDRTNSIINALNGEGNISYYSDAGYFVPSNLLDGQCDSSVFLSIGALCLSLGYLIMWYTLSCSVEQPNRNNNERV